MKENIGKTDRAIRFIVGAILVYFAFATNIKLLTVIFSGLAAISIYESYTGFCGIYKILKINTGDKK